jgi:pilus assembly protein CpaE
MWSGASRTEGKKMSNGTAIAILGAKGGVGTTTVAANLAAALTQDSERSVLLLDLNLFLGDVGLHVGIEAQPTVMQWMLGSEETNNKDDIPTHPLGFRVLGLASDLSDAEAVPAEDVLRLLDRMRSYFDVIVVDAGTDLNEVSLTTCRYADHRLLVTTEQRPSLIGAKRRLDVLRKLGIPGEVALGVINRAHADSGVSPAVVKQAIGLSVIARIRNAWADNQEALASQKLLIEHCPDANVTHDYTQIVRHMRY